MTLQDFFISGLPTGGGNNEIKSRPTTTERQISESSDQDKNRLKLPQPTTTNPKPSISKRISFFKSIIL